MKTPKEYVAVLFLCFLLFISWFMPDVALFTLSNRNSYTPILDAGHGYPDGGAVGADGTAENELNLDICKRADILFQMFYLLPVLTRTDENGIWDDSCESIREKKISDMKNRVKLVNSVQNGFLISVHQNSYAQNTSGLQIFYSDSKSLDYAEKVAAFCSDGNKISVRDCKSVADNLYLFKNSQCPGILIESGYISSENDLKLLKTDNYREWVALCIVCGFIDCMK